MYKAIIVEDEFLLAKVIENYLLNFESISLVHKYESAIEALNFLEKEKVDLIFLDIEMPLINGVEFARKIDKSIDIIFTTAYSEYAVEGFNLNALDYLLKPIKFDRFHDSIQKFLNKRSKESTVSKNESIIIKTDGVYHKLIISDIIYIESLKEYVRYYTTSQKFMIYGSLSKAVEKIETHGFIRIHKSYACAMQHILSIKGNKVLLVNNVTLPIGRTYKNDILRHFK